MDEFTVGREPLQIVEIVQPSCSLTYGSAPCEAVIGTTGSIKCFNTAKTCQDISNYSPLNTITWRFRKPDESDVELFESTASDIKTNPIPALLSVSTNPTRINIGGGNDNESPFGVRGSVNISMTDFKYDDAIGDNYVSERTYNPVEQGTFWSKWLARNPYYNKYIVNVYDGYHGQALSEMVRRTYLITDMTLNPSRGTVSIKAKDPLNLADNKKSQAPVANELELRDAINNSQTTGIIFVGSESDLSDSMGNSGFYIRLGDEIVQYTGYSVLSSDQFELVGVTRAALNTIADSFDAEESGQRVIRYVDISVWDLIYDLLINYTDVDSSYINLTEWEDEGLDVLPSFVLTGTIAEPVGVNDLLSELTEQCLVYIWWDDQSRLIRFKAIAPERADPIALDDENNILEKSLSQTLDTKQRISRCVVYYGQKDPTQDQDDTANYSNVRIHVNADAESSIQYGEVITRNIYSRWLTTKAQSSQLATYMVNKYSEVPIRLQFMLDAKDRYLKTSDVVSVSHYALQDATGANDVQNWQIISIDEKVHGEMLKVDVQKFFFSGKYGYFMAPGNDYGTSTEQEKDEGCFFSDTDGLLPDGADGYQYQ